MATFYRHDETTTTEDTTWTAIEPRHTYVWWSSILNCWLSSDVPMDYDDNCALTLDNADDWL